MKKNPEKFEKDLLSFLESYHRMVGNIYEEGDYDYIKEKFIEKWCWDDESE